jgi:hypothetical protein
LATALVGKLSNRHASVDDGRRVVDLMRTRVTSECLETPVEVAAVLPLDKRSGAAGGRSDAAGWHRDRERAAFV